MSYSVDLTSPDLKLFRAQQRFASAIEKFNSAKTSLGPEREELDAAHADLNKAEQNWFSVQPVHVSPIRK